MTRCSMLGIEFSRARKTRFRPAVRLSAPIAPAPFAVTGVFAGPLAGAGIDRPVGRPPDALAGLADRLLDVDAVALLFPAYAD